jgi:hypothetical protein
MHLQDRLVRATALGVQGKLSEHNMGQHGARDKEELLDRR